MRGLIIILFISSICGCIQAQEVVPSLSLKEAEKIFLERNLSLLAERYNMDLAQAQLRQARLFDNPVVSLEQNVYNRLNGKYFDVGKEGETIVEIEQVIYLAGQRNKRVRLEKVNKEMAAYQFEEVLRRLRSELNKTFVEISFLTRSIDLYEQEINSLSRLLQVMKEQQKKGNSSLMECARMEALLLSLRKEKNEVENKRVDRQSELNLLLNLPAEQKMNLLLDDEILKQIEPARLSLADLKSLLALRPDLKIAQARIAAARSNLKLQRALAAPEVSVKGIYDKAGNFINNYFGIGVGISLPIFNRNQGNIQAAKVGIQQSSQEEVYALEKAQKELYAAYAQLQKAIELFRSSSTDLESNFHSLREGIDENFRKRNISMLEFIDYYQSYKEASLQLDELKKNVFLAMENLNTLVGQTIFNY